MTAADISETAGIEILNKDHVICHLDDGADLYMELTVNTGKGYVAADKNKPEDAPIGMIADRCDLLAGEESQLRRAADPRRSGSGL